jgi:hypothetical protein
VNSAALSMGVQVSLVNGDLNSSSCIHKSGVKDHVYGSFVLNFFEDSPY